MGAGGGEVERDGGTAGLTDQRHTAASLQISIFSRAALW